MWRVKEMAITMKMKHKKKKGAYRIHATVAALLMLPMVVFFVARAAAQPWSGSLNNAGGEAGFLVIDAVAGKSYDITLTASGLEGGSSGGFSIEVPFFYDPAIFEASSLDLFSDDPITAPGIIEGTNVEITYAAPGEARFLIERDVPAGAAWSGAVTALRLEAVAAGISEVTFGGGETGGGDAPEYEIGVTAWAEALESHGWEYSDIYEMDYHLIGMYEWENIVLSPQVWVYDEYGSPEDMTGQIISATYYYWGNEYDTLAIGSPGEFDGGDLIYNEAMIEVQVEMPGSILLSYEFMCFAYTMPPR